MAALREIDVPRWIDEQKIGGFQIAIVALCAAVVFMDGFDTQAINYVAPAISAAWKLGRGALGPVFSAGLVGLMLGALIFGPVADSVGRRPVILFCTVFFGVCALLTVTATSLDGLLAWRFITGLGLGGAMPNAIALTSEYSPERSRASLIMIMFCGFSLGSLLGGLIAAQVLKTVGWTGIFWVGGFLPLLLAVALALALPESIRLLALRGGEDERVRSLIARIKPGASFPRGIRFTASRAEHQGFPVRQLFRERRALATLLLWAMFFMNLLDLYFLASWLPTVIHSAGTSEAMAAIAASLFQVGGIIGVFLLGWLIDRERHPYRVLGAAYVAAAVFIALTGAAVGARIGWIMAAVAASGFCIVGGQIGANALTAIYYPTAIRSTGVGWALGIGRIGSIIGPVVGGLLLQRALPTPALFLVAAVPALLAAAAAFALGWAGAGAAVRLARAAPG